MFLRIISFVLLFTAANAACDNQCSGHGTCMTDDVCNCYDNWGVGLSHDSGDCSERVCPFELAWVDTPNKVGAFHKYAECSGRGICARDTGECSCFDGYEGKACQRTTCPNDCSGHGTCEFIEDMAFTEFEMTGFVEGGSKKFPYTQWDSRKIRGCVCDATYGDVDCSKRMCPYGTDVLDVRDDLLVSTKYQVQMIEFITPTYDPSQDYVARRKLAPKGAEDEILNDGQTFALTFKSRLNETFTTIPIVMDASDTNDLVHDIQLALLNLPNRVIDGITVAGENTGDGRVAINITFTGPSVQGPQHLLTVQSYECAEGCTPKLSGLNLETRFNFISKSNITEVRLADYNSYECGRRGKCDYASGLCQCFLGYTGDNCNTLTTLV